MGLAMLIAIGIFSGFVILESFAQEAKPPTAKPVDEKFKEPVEEGIDEPVDDIALKRQIIKEKFQEKLLNRELISEGSKKVQSEKRVIILYKEKMKNYDMDDLKLKKARIDRMLDKSNAVAVTIDEKYLDEIKSQPNVIGVMSQTLVHASLGSTESGVVEIIKANQVHDNLSTGNGVKVCVIDTGIDHSHPDFQGVPILYEFDFENSDSDASDDEGHGTHVTATIASKSASYRGVAPGVTLYIAKVLDENGSGTFANVANAIDWCADGPDMTRNTADDADIISMSLGGPRFSGVCDTNNPPHSADLQAALDAANQAFSDGVVVLAASGNDFSSSRIDTPACASGVIAVGAVDSFDTQTDFSNESSELELVAPGVNLVAAKLGGGHEPKTGTSMATPVTAGVAALVLEQNPGFTSTQVRDALKNNAVDLDASNCISSCSAGPGEDNVFGFGRVDALASAPDVDYDTLCNRIVVLGNVIMGTSGDDIGTIDGTAGDDVINGFAGNDIINGNGGNDCILGGLGNDILDGGDGDDYVIGGVGIDNLDGWTGNDSIFGGYGADSLIGGAGSDTLEGGLGNDYLFGYLGNDILNGGEGVDLLKGFGNDLLNGQEGADLLIAGGANDSIAGGAGNDTCDGQDIPNLTFTSCETIFNQVIDVTPPVITISGNNPVTHEAGSPYSDAGATALDDVEGDITSRIITTNNVNPNVVGVYTVDYSVTDTAGLTTMISRTINVEDNTPPVTTIDFVLDGNLNLVSNGGAINSDSLSIVFSGTDNLSLPNNLTFECNYDSSVYLPCTNPYTLTGINDATYGLEIRTTDEEGNVESTASFTWRVDTVPFCNGMTASELIASGIYNVIDNRGGASGTFTGTVNADLMIAGDNGDTMNGIDGNDCLIGGAGINVWGIRK